MSNIPSNYTFEETLEFYPREFSDDVLAIAWREVVEKRELEQELVVIRRRFERLEEQLHFRDEWIKDVIEEAAKATKVQELRSFIKTSIENSYIEL